MVSTGGFGGMPGLPLSGDGGVLMGLALLLIVVGIGFVVLKSIDV